MRTLTAFSWEEKDRWNKKAKINLKRSRLDTKGEVTRAQGHKH
jgi:hypothetical protein